MVRLKTKLNINSDDIYVITEQGFELSIADEIKAMSNIIPGACIDMRL